MSTDQGHGPRRGDGYVPAGIRNALDIWHRIEVWVAVVAFSLIALLLIYDVLVREALTPILTALGFGHARLIIYGSQKIAVFLLVIGAFSGIGIAAWLGAQLVPRLAFRAVPDVWNGAMNRLADAVTFLFLVAVTVVSARFVWDSYAASQMASGGIRIESWKVQIAIPLGFASAALRYLAFAIWPGIRPEGGEGPE